MKYLVLIISYLPALQFLPGIAKIAKAKPVLDNLAKLQTGSFIPNNLRLVGMAEVLVVALFILPATMHLGFFLLCSWLGGAMMIHIASDDKPIPPVILLILVWVSAYLRDASLFTFVG